jgi:hypothetical protein
MALYDEIIAIYTELTMSDLFGDGTIVLRDDSDGVGAYIEKWEYSKPIPDGLKLGK